MSEIELESSGLLDVRDALITTSFSSAAKLSRCATGDIAKLAI
jgi:hypothetical protein